LRKSAFFGREKGASDLAPEASADLSDFLDLTPPLSFQERVKEGN